MVTDVPPSHDQQTTLQEFRERFPARFQERSFQIFGRLPFPEAFPSDSSLLIASRCEYSALRMQNFFRPLDMWPIIT